MLQRGRLNRGSLYDGSLNRRLVIPGSASGPVLLARTIYPDSMGKLVLPTEARTTDLYAADHEGVYRLFESGEPAVVGGRVVRNLVPDSEDLSGWTVTSATFVGGQEDKDGGLNAYRLTATSNNASAFVFTGSQVDGKATLNSIWIRRISGTGNVRLNNGRTWDIMSSVDSTWKRFTTGLSVGSSGGWNIGVFLDISGDVVDIYLPQVENATGRTDTTTPSEYVSSDVGLAVYATENGNSVASNVVTEAVGADLSPAPYVLTTPGATNSCAYSQDLTGTGWSDVGTPTKSQNQTDIFGNANSAWTVGDDNGAGLEGVQFTATVPDDSNNVTGKIRIEKVGSTPSNYPLVVLDLSGGTWKVGGAFINHNAGTSNAWSNGAGLDDITIEDDGTHFIVTASLANNGTGNTTAQWKFYPAGNGDFGASLDATTTGSCVIDQAEIFLNTAHAVAHALPPIPTSGMASNIDITEVDEADAPTSNFVLKFKWTPEYEDQGTVWLIGNYTDANNAWGVLHDGTNIIFRNRVSGSNNDATKALNYVFGTEYEITVRHSKVNGLDIWVDGTKGTNDSTTTDVTSAASTFFGQDGNDANAGINGFRAYRRWSIPANYSDAATVALSA